MKVELKGLDRNEIEDWAAEQGLEAYRGRQIRQWLFKGRVTAFDEMTNLPKALRRELENRAIIVNLETAKIQVASDDTRKYLFRLRDGLHIESVLIPERDHRTLCISSQAGCALGCRFCLTARQGLRRNLTAAEIVDQVVQVMCSMENPDRLTNLVLMGMGEPLANYDAVIKALANLMADDGLNFSHRKVTLSTSGLVPRIGRLGKDTTVNLAVSLNAADDQTRSLLMPINRQYPIRSLMAACGDFPLPNRRRITFEYILMNGVNDRDEDARALTGLLSGLPAKINLIPLNPHPDIDFSPTPHERIIRFQQILIDRHFTAIIRKSKGQDISAACGQLSGEA